MIPMEFSKMLITFKRSSLTAHVFASFIGFSFFASPPHVQAREYDAEFDIGLVAENPAAAQANTERLTAALEAQWSGGAFKFKAGRLGPVLFPIRASAKEFFFAGTIETSTRIGGALYGFGSRGYAMTSGHYSPTGTLGGATTRFTRLDGEKGGAIIRLRGAGFILEGIELRGRPYLDDQTGEGPKTGTKTPVGVEVEGRAFPATGEHVIRNCAITDCNVGICARAGYYKAGKFERDENHADNSIVDGVLFYAVESCFRSENQQAVVWSFRDIDVRGWGGAGANDTVVCDIVRGGNIAIHGLSLNQGRTTIFKVHDYSPNNCRLVCNDLRWDTFYGPAIYLTLFHYDGPVYPDMSWIHWSVRISGHIANAKIKPQYDASKLLQVPSKLPLDDFKLDVANLPKIDGIPLGTP
jgi:hypothetical protein